MTKKRRKRSGVNLGWTSSEHSEKLTSLLRVAQQQRDRAYGEQKCSSAIAGLAHAMHTLGAAGAHVQSMGYAAGRKGPRAKLRALYDKLDRQTRKDLLGALKNCALEYPK